MTRTGDVAPPTVTPHPIVPNTPLSKWVPWRPVFALEQLPQAAYVWDDTDPAVVWDQPGPTRLFVFPGVAGNWLSVPAAAALSPSGDVELVARIKPNTWRPAAQSAIVARYRTTPTNERSYNLALGTAGTLVWVLSADGGTTAQAVSTVAIPNDGAARWIKATRVRTSGSVTFYTAPDAMSEPTTWTQLGTPVVAGAGQALFPSTSAPVELGSIALGTTQMFAGRIMRAIVRNGIAGPAVLDVAEANAAGLAVGSTSFTATTGQTVTVAQTGANQIVQADPTDWAYVWDAPFIGGGFSDAACDWMAFDVDPGEPDELYVFPTVEATLTLANANGAYTPWSSDGRLVYWAPGRRMCVYWLHTSTAEKRWLFSGRVASWQVNADDTVTVTAFDGFPALAQQIGPWTPGAAGDTPRARILAVAATAQYTDPIVADIGDVTLSTAETTDAPLDVIEQAALSDGGLFYGDADGSLRYANRLWRAGRTDAPKAWVVSDNVCTVPVVVWNPEAAADDERLATVVRLANAAGLIATATAADTLWTGGARWVLTHPDPDLWQTQQQGDTLAAHLLAQQSTPSMALNRFDIYGLDPHQAAVSDFATDVRRGDRLEVLHEYVDPDGLTGTLDLFAIVLGVGHNLTPDEWVSHYQLSRTVDWRTVELWDRTVYVWDETAGTAAANNVWRY